MHGTVVQPFYQRRLPEIFMAILVLAVLTLILSIAMIVEAVVELNLTGAIVFIMMALVVIIIVISENTKTM